MTCGGKTLHEAMKLVELSGENRLIKDMARAMNSDEHDYKPEKEV